MTVAELIACLGELPPDLPVWADADEGGYNYVPIHIADVVHDFDGHDVVMLRCRDVVMLRCAH